MARPTLGRHKKFKRLVRRLRPLLGTLPVDPATVARGMLEALWLPAYKNNDPHLENTENIN